MNFQFLLHTKFWNNIKYSHFEHWLTAVLKYCTLFVTDFGVMRGKIKTYIYLFLEVNIYTAFEIILSGTVYKTEQR